MSEHTHSPHCEHRNTGNWPIWAIGLGSLFWLLLRSGTKPRRLAYPCQRVALANSIGFLGYLSSILGSAILIKRLRQGLHSPYLWVPALLALLLLGITGSISLPERDALAAASPSGWIGDDAVSDVFVITDVPTPTCSLDGGDTARVRPVQRPRLRSAR